MDEQKCENCLTTRTLDYFRMLKRGKNGNPDIYARNCLVCKDSAYDPNKKYCCDCGNYKLKSEFHGHKKLSHICKDCERKEYEKNKTYIKAFRNIKDGKFRANTYRKLRNFYSIDGKTLLENKNGVVWNNILPYTIEEFKEYIESQMEDWMNWDNWRDHNAKTHDINPTWDLYLIKPIEVFENSMDCWNLSNILVHNSIKTVEENLRREVPDRRICIGCNIEKEIELFKAAGDSYSHKCKDCRNKERREDRAAYPEKYKERDKIKFQKRKHKVNEKNKERRSLDPVYKLRVYTSNSIREACKGKKDNLSITKYLPYSIEQLKNHLEALWEPWMNWNNWSKYNPLTHDTNPTWNIDHIIPHASFKYESMEDPEFIKCWALSNLRPLDSRINSIENARGYNGKGKIIVPIKFKQMDSVDVENSNIFKEVK